MKYIYRPHNSKMVTLMTTFGAGSRVEFGTSYPAGIAHLMEHSRFLGTNKYTGREWLQKIESIGGLWNAETDEDLVSYYLTVPEEHIETACDCLSQIVRHTTFPAKEFKKEQEVVCQEVRMYDDDMDDQVHRALMAGAFKGGSLESPIIGTEDSVRSITRDHLVAFNEEFYRPDNQLLVLCAPWNCAGFIEQYFGCPEELVWNSALTTNYSAPFSQRIEKEGQLQNQIRIAYGGKELDNEALNNPARLDVFNGIFGHGGASRLYLKIREELGLVYGIGSGVNDNMDGTLFEIGTATEPENEKVLLEEVDRQIEIIQDTLPTEDELNCAKNKIKSCEYSMADASFSTALKVVDEVFYNNQPTKEYLAAINKVTAKDVREVARKVFSGNKYLVVGCDKE